MSEPYDYWLDEQMQLTEPPPNEFDDLEASGYYDDRRVVDYGEDEDTGEHWLGLQLRRELDETRDGGAG